MSHINFNNPYGVDFDLFTDLTTNARVIDGKRNVLNAIAGYVLDQLWYSPNLGIDLVGRIRQQDPRTYNSLATETENVILKADDRISDVNVTISQPDSNRNVDVRIDGELSNGESFSLIGNVNSFEVSDFQFAAAE